MHVFRAAGSLILASSLFAIGCSGDAGPFEEVVEVDELGVATLEVVTPAPLVVERETDGSPRLFVNPGERVDFDFEALDRAGVAAELSQSDRDWRVDAPSVATIDRDGVLTPVGDGEVRVSVSIGGIDSVPQPVTVSQADLVTIERIDGAEAPDACRAYRYTAVGTFDDQSSRALPDARFERVGGEAELRDPLNDAGEPQAFGGVDVVPTAPGTALVLRASAAGQALDRTLNVSTALQSIAIPDVARAVSVDRSIDLTVDGVYADGGTTDGADTVGDGADTSDDGGDAGTAGDTGTSDGDTGVTAGADTTGAPPDPTGGTATAGSATAGADTSGTPDPTGSITAGADTSGTPDPTGGATTAGSDTTGTTTGGTGGIGGVEDAGMLRAGERTVDITDNVTWSLLSGTGFATISNSSPTRGRLQGDAAGTVDVEARCGDFTAVAQVVVSADSGGGSNDGLAFEDDEVTIGFGQTVRLRVSTGSRYDRDDDVTERVTFESNDEDVVRIREFGTEDDAGELVPVAPGTATIRAQLGGDTATARVTVTGGGGQTGGITTGGLTGGGF